MPPSGRIVWAASSAPADARPDESTRRGARARHTARRENEGHPVKVVAGGEFHQRAISPTVLEMVNPDSPVMHQEIFWPAAADDDLQDRGRSVRFSAIQLLYPPYTNFKKKLIELTIKYF